MRWWDELVGRLEEEVAHEIQASDVPGIAVGLCGADGAQWARGFGTTGGGLPGSGREVGVDTMFSVQSSSKLVTATGVLLAVQEGLVELDEPIVRHLPDFTVHSDFEDRPERLITLRHLLTHTAGFTHEAPVGSNYEVSDASFEAHLATIAQTYLRFPVGHHHEYSNLGIDLAGHVAAVASGESFAQFMRTRLFEPLGLARSTYDFDTFRADPDRAWGHSKVFAAAGRAVPARVPMVPSGGLYASLGDLLRYLTFQLHEGESLLLPELIRQHLSFPRLTGRQDQGYGLGLYVDRWAPGVRVLHHGGAGFGFLCQVFWMPDHGIGGAVLTNSVDHDLQNQLAARIVLRVADADRLTTPAAPTPPATPAPPATSRPPSSRAGSEARPEELAGTYVGRLGDTCVFSAEDDALARVATDVDVVASEGALTSVMAGDVAAVVEDPGADPVCRLVFLRGVDGHVHYLLDEATGEVRYRTRVPELAPSTLEPTLAGDYESRIDGVRIAPYRLRQDGGVAVIDLPRHGSLTDPITLQLVSIAPDRYLSATGEVLTVGASGVAYANIPLFQVASAQDATVGADR